MDGSPADQMDPNQGNYAMMPYNMPMPSQSPSDNGSAVPASYVEIRPNVFTEPPSLNVMEMMPSTNAAMMPYPTQGIDFNSQPSYNSLKCSSNSTTARRTKKL
ncbi:hypothetical protein TNIN_109981 [Trichonephila inaurata madagascariensis]|uniref:Uncharacterized protein n=1 Tax=Trichonephila inaurata madagascariensis TaxID=2747483 RepID=A0A8X6XRM6_9ARAC|nr:hypothetical protein TNIN_109981 [Trichonephila inaurata madagascariensis]